MKQGDLRKAAELYGQSFTKYPAPTTAYWEARTLVRLGRLVEARERYRVAASWALDAQASEAFRASVSQASAELAALDRRIPVLVVDVERAVSAAITIDGRSVSGPGRHRVDPGDHVVAATATDHDPFEANVHAAESEETTVHVRLVPHASSEGEGERAPRPAPTAAAGGGQRVAGLVIGGV